MRYVIEVLKMAAASVQTAPMRCAKPVSLASELLRLRETRKSTALFNLVVFQSGKRHGNTPVEP